MTVTQLCHDAKLCYCHGNCKNGHAQYQVPLNYIFYDKMAFAIMKQISRNQTNLLTLLIIITQCVRKLCYCHEKTCFQNTWLVLISSTGSNIQLNHTTVCYPSRKGWCRCYLFTTRKYNTTMFFILTQLVYIYIYIHMCGCVHVCVQQYMHVNIML